LTGILIHCEFVAEGDLAQVPNALDTAGLIAGPRQRRQEQRRQDGNNGDNHQQLNQGKTRHHEARLRSARSFVLDSSAPEAHNGTYFEHDLLTFRSELQTKLQGVRLDWQSDL
jgi:ribosomal 30S subunit maturation factor RimM